MEKEKRKHGAGRSPYTYFLMLLFVAALICFAVVVILALLGRTVGNVYSNIYMGDDFLSSAQRLTLTAKALLTPTTTP